MSFWMWILVAVPVLIHWVHSSNEGDKMRKYEDFYGDLEEYTSERADRLDD